MSDKMGVDERRFYKSMIKLVETEFLNHLKERGLCDSRLKRAVGSQAVRERTDYIKYIFSTLIIFVFNFYIWVHPHIQHMLNMAHKNTFEYMSPV
ncbi:hypothetical protein [Plesiomonas sp. ZOR0011]|uniref:hypothetical protein n=1 Tax=Plesiomonas sp. ZOR0011 TaxID=1339230 RepID=UPI0015A62292|nr:hypothetical protein [Plesiomonas sp. ZOR0011]